MMLDAAIRSIIDRLQALEQRISRQQSIEVSGAPKVLLHYSAVTDLFSGAAVAASVWTTVVPAQSFTVGANGSIVEVSVSGGAFGIAPGGEAQAAIVIDGSAYYYFGGNYATNGNALGSRVVPLTGLAAGGHSVEVQVWHNAGYTNLYLRCASQPAIENVSMYVTELKG